MPRVQCERCGMEWTINSVRRKVILCQSCRARKVQTVHSTEHGKCLPWAGHFGADEVTPVDDDVCLCFLVSEVVAIMIVCR